MADSYTMSGALPLYGDVAPLDADRQAHLAILPSEAPFGFAREAPTVRLIVDEFERAMLDYPIVFYGPARLPVAVTGLQPGLNLFVDAEGRYAPGAYIPGYLRRDPFVAAAVNATEAIVCIDEGAACVVPADTSGAVALFDGDEPSMMTQGAIALVHAYAEGEVRTEAFGAMLDEFDLLEPRQAHYTAPDGERRLLLDYAAVSRERLAALSPEQLVQLRDNGTLPAIYAHVFSAANWDKLPIWAQ